LLDTVERQSRLVTLVYQVLGTLEPPPIDALKGEVLAALASAFHRQAVVAMEADALAAREAERGRLRGESRLPEYASIFPWR
jgi:hypothetical protein